MKRTRNIQSVAPTKAKKARPDIDPVFKRNDTELPMVLSSQSLSKREEYAEKFKNLLEMEHQDETAQVEERLRWSTDKLISEGVALFELKATSTGYSAGHPIFTFTLPKGQRIGEQSKIISGDTVFISRDSPKVGLNMTMGEVYERGGYYLKVVVPNPPDDIEEGIWRIDQSCNNIAHQRMLDALERFASHTKINYVNEEEVPEEFLPDRENTTPLERIIMDEPENAKDLAKEPSILSRLHSDDFPEAKKKLNESQMTVLTSVVKETLSLIQGPPGTGKTSTAVMLIKRLTEFYDGKLTILATAYTNVAIDNLLEGLLNAGINALRLGSPTKIREGLRENTLENKTRNHHLQHKVVTLQNYIKNLNIEIAKVAHDYQQGLRRELFKAKNDLNTLKRHITKEVITGCSVLCSTCIGAGDPQIADYCFPLVVIDEATQCSEPAALVPIVRGAQQLILLGDHYQLPPTIVSHRAREAGLVLSLFERMIKQGVQPHVLQIQYRMHPIIAQFPSSHFYHGEIRDGVDGENRKPPKGFPAGPDQPVVFIHVEGTEETQENGRSKRNFTEAKLVVEIVRNLLLGGEIARSDIGVLTPYAAQRNLLTTLFKNDKIFSTPLPGDVKEEGENALTQLAGGLNVSSVDGFQGREQEVIIFTCVRSNDKGEVGFLSDWRRLNVALTRPRRGIVVVGNKKTLSNDEHWKSWLDWIQEKAFELTDFSPAGIKASEPATIEPFKKKEAVP
eukprot:TRINITY_DN878_c0_g1_i1.p1 TRINITY_DN878_c0_g1~~TRINITY_DN878_c0_g1_i1.p1  ORF type:complete len:735 (-),score=165.04 TRINITY_DN878_c0_g1_i1:86-2290(-)